MLINGETRQNGAIVRGRSSEKISEETRVISLPEFVSVRDRIDIFATLSYMAATSNFLTSRAI